MLDALAEKLQATLGEVRQRGTLTEDDVNRAMREIRLALLEADVNFKVVKQFTNDVKQRALGADVLQQLDAGQQVVKIVNEELTALMGGASRDITFASRPPTVILMAGLQGSGKTTAAAKLARFLREERRANVALAACDVYRPAAVDQLVTVGRQAGAHVYEQGTDRDPVDIAGWALDQARADGRDVLIVDTSGRLHVDRELMEELAKVRAMGPLTGLLKMLPGASGLGLGDLKVDDRDLDRLQAIITSMTPEERAHPEILNGSRRRRIARGSGTTVQAVNQLVKQFGQMQKLMRQLQQGKMPSLSQLAGGR